jgi:hypothetical protein
MSVGTIQVPRWLWEANQKLPHDSDTGAKVKQIKDGGDIFGEAR